MEAFIRAALSNPSITFFLVGLVAITAIGTALLATPWVTVDGTRTPLIDAFFTAANYIQSASPHSTRATLHD